MVIGDKSMTENTELTLAIELPELDVDASRITTCTCGWCQQDISPEFFNLGFEFKEVTDKQKTVIEAIMENYEFRRDIPIQSNLHRAIHGPRIKKGVTVQVRKSVVISLDNGWPYVNFGYAKSPLVIFHCAKTS
jgi:hypothetical protein